MSGVEAAGAICTQLRKVAADLLAAKKAGKSADELSAIATKGSLLMVELRGANRALYEDVEGAKDSTESAKLEVEERYSVLQNLLYEKNHYDKEIRGCKDFESAYTEGEIGLLGEKEFLAEAPEEMREGGAGDEHRMMLNRLSYELQQRKELVKQKEELVEHSKNLQGAVRTKRKFLDSLQIQVKNMKKATLPLQQHLSIAHSKESKQVRSSKLLPPPLYVLFTQFQGYQQAFDEPFVVSITGSVTEAEALARKEVAEALLQSTGEAAREEGAGNDEDEEEEGSRAKRHKKWDAGDDAYSLHPLSVTLELLVRKGGGKLMAVKFEYLRRMNLVVASCEDLDDNPLLVNFFPGDTGDDTPNVANKQGGEGAGIDPGMVARPFLWVQHAAGLDFLPEVPPKLVRGGEEEAGGDGDGDGPAVVDQLARYRAQGRVSTILERLRARKQAAMSLMSQLASLEKLDIPVKVPSDAVPAMPKSTLRNWAEAAGRRRGTPGEGDAKKDGEREREREGGRGRGEKREGGEREAPRKDEGDREAEVEEALRARPEPGGGGGAEDGELPADPMDVDDDKPRATAPAPPAAPDKREALGGDEEEGEAAPEAPARPPPAARAADDDGEDDAPAPPPMKPKAASVEAEAGAAKGEEGGGDAAAGGGGGDDEGPDEGAGGEVARQSDSQPWHERGSRRFRASVRHAERRVEIEALFTVYAEYPVRAPRVQLRLRRSGLTPAPAALAPPVAAGVPAALSPLPISNSAALQAEAAADLRTMEAEVNLHCRELVPPGQQDLLLSYQVMRLLQCLDVHVLHERWAGAPPGGEAGTGRVVRGRERRKALVPDPATKTYDHR